MSDLISVAKTSHFSIDAEVGANTLTLVFAGTVDEDFDFNRSLQFVDQVAGGQPLTLQFKLKGVTRLNSCGVRSWVLFLERIQPKYPVILVELGEAFIEQAAVVPAMLGKKKTPVVDFEAPYLCVKCNHRYLKTLNISEVFAKPDGTYDYPGFVCDTCRLPLEFESLPEEYFSFLTRVQG